MCIVWYTCMPLPRAHTLNAFGVFIPLYCVRSNSTPVRPVVCACVAREGRKPNKEHGTTHTTTTQQNSRKQETTRIYSNRLRVYIGGGGRVYFCIYKNRFRCDADIVYLRTFSHHAFISH